MFLDVWRSFQNICDDFVSRSDIDILTAIDCEFTF